MVLDVYKKDKDRKDEQLLRIWNLNNTGKYDCIVITETWVTGLHANRYSTMFSENKLTEEHAISRKICTYVGSHRASDEMC